MDNRENPELFTNWHTLFPKNSFHENAERIGMLSEELIKLATWGILIGLLLIGMALSSTFIKRLPLSEAMIYLLVGVALSSSPIALLNIDIQAHAAVLEHIAEIALLISLFSAGLKLQLPLRNRHWRLSLRLATITMIITVALLAAMGLAFDLSLGVAIALGATLAPTDPVLASDVQVANSADRDRLRFSLTAESGLNDGIALPLILLGLGLINAEAGFTVWQWLGVQVLWSTIAGLMIGAFFGSIIGWLVIYLRTRQKEAIGLDEFLVVGVLALTWGACVLCAASPFLAVLAAGLAMPRSTHVSPTPTPLPEHRLEQAAELATDPQHAAPLMIRAVLGFNEQIERIAEVTVVVLVGALLPIIDINAFSIAVALALIFVIRPIAVNVTLIGVPIDRAQRRMLSWFGIRGIGSIYYLFYVIRHGLPSAQQNSFTAAVLLAVAMSIVLHGISVTPLMARYKARKPLERKKNPT
jgi:NhaP-type Na+/H+ or K+/H+ antiporter